MTEEIEQVAQEKVAETPLQVFSRILATKNLGYGTPKTGVTRKVKKLSKNSKKISKKSVKKNRQIAQKKRRATGSKQRK